MNEPRITINKWNFIKAKSYKLKAVQGFSLIEMMVAVALFTIVAMVSISALLSVNDANRKAQTMRAVIDNLNFAMENMARNLRVGTVYNCGAMVPASSPRDCSTGDDSIAFEAYNGDPSSSGDQIVYKLDWDAPNNKGQIMKSSNSGTTFLPLTPFTLGATFQPLVVDYLKFYVTGSVQGDSIQPRIIIVVGGEASYNEKIKTRFLMQTNVSQRRLDL